MSPTVVAFVTACTALVAALVGPFVTFKISKAQIKAVVLSSNRQKWIEAFRDIVASFCSQAFAASLLRSKIIEDGHIVAVLDPDLLRRLEDITRTFVKIRLMVNPTEVDQQKLLKAWYHEDLTKRSA